MRFTQIASAKAIIIACAIFAMLFCSNVATYAAVGLHLKQTQLVFWLQLFKILVFLIPGYVSAFIAKRFGAIHGAVVGMTECLIMVIFYSFRDGHIHRPFVESWYFWIVFCLITAGLGGMAWDFQTFVSTHIKARINRV